MSKIYRVGLVGLGFMGSSHFSTYQKMKDNNLNVTLVAICDVDEKKFKSGELTQGNLEIGGSSIDLSPYKLYNDMAEMIEKEELDFVDLCLPTYLHGPMAIKAMRMNVHVFCEKPMGISSDMCAQMIEVSKETGKLLMIGHTLRYWNCYEFVKDYVDNKTFGECTSAYFFRGGSTPIWSWENWLLQKEKSGGCLFDQHIHDVDAVNWIFGMPKALSAIGKVVNKGNGYDAVSVNYVYEDGKVINTQDDWTINGAGFGFKMEFRINFEKGAIILDAGKLTVYPVGGEKYIPELSSESAYYKELRLFLEYIEDPSKIDHIALLEDHRRTLMIAEAEEKSIDNGGELIKF